MTIYKGKAERKLAGQGNDKITQADYSSVTLRFFDGGANSSEVSINTPSTSASSFSASRRETERSNGANSPMPSPISPLTLDSDALLSRTRERLITGLSASGVDRGGDTTLSSGGCRKLDSCGFSGVPKGSSLVRRAGLGIAVLLKLLTDDESDASESQPPWMSKKLFMAVFFSIMALATETAAQWGVIQTFAEVKTSKQ